MKIVLKIMFAAGPEMWKAMQGKFLKVKFTLKL